MKCLFEATTYTVLKSYIFHVVFYLFIFYFGTSDYLQLAILCFLKLHI